MNASFWRLVGAILVIGLLVCLQPAWADPHIMDEQAFWQALGTTNTQLHRAIDNPSDRASLVQQIEATWQPVKMVRLYDQSTISIDMGWLLDNLPNADTVGLQTIQQHVQAIIDARTQATTNSRDLMPTLNKVMQDPRFHYQDSQMPNISVPNLGPVGEVLVALFVLAVIVMGLVYFGQRLRIQPASRPEPLNFDADPDTAALAQEKAASSEAIHDYRSAIRYLYLYSLLLLNERGLIHYDRTLTNREHLRQIRNKHQLSDLLRPVVDTFDNVWYGFVPVDEAMYRAFRQDVEQLAHYQAHEP